MIHSCGICGRTDRKQDWASICLTLQTPFHNIFGWIKGKNNLKKQNPRKRHSYQTAWKLSEWGWNHKRVSWSTEAHWTGRIKHLTWNCNPFIFNIYSTQTGQAPGGTTSAATSAAHDSHFRRGSFLRRTRCQSPRRRFSPHPNRLKSTILKAHFPPCLVGGLKHFNQAFPLSPKWLIRTIKSSIKTPKRADVFCLKRSAILSDSPHNSPTRIGGGGGGDVLPSSDIPKRLWKGCLCALVRIPSAVIAPYSCGNN